MQGSPGLLIKLSLLIELKIYVLVIENNIVLLYQLQPKSTLNHLNDLLIRNLSRVYFILFHFSFKVFGLVVDGF